MSNWTKGFIGVAILSQVALFIILFGCKAEGSFYITGIDLFSLVLCSLNTVVYIFASITSYYNDMGEAFCERVQEKISLSLVCNNG